MILYRWYAHSWYFTPSWLPWLHQIELTYDLRHWAVGISFAGRLYTLSVGPLCISYQSGL